MDECNCIDCRIEREHGSNPSDEVINAFGGCRYCAMTGFENYPSNTKPCRLGHTAPPPMYLPPLPEPEDKPQYVLDGNWEWSGRGWKNLDWKPKSLE